MFFVLLCVLSGSGFTEQEITNALKVSNFNAESAISYLLEDSSETANKDGADAIFNFEDDATVTSTVSPRPLSHGTAATSTSSTNGTAGPSKQSLSPKIPARDTSASSSSLSEWDASLVNKHFPPHLSSSGITSTASSPGPQVATSVVDEAKLNVSFSGLAAGDDAEGAAAAGVQRFQVGCVCCAVCSRSVCSAVTTKCCGGLARFPK